MKTFHSEQPSRARRGFTLIELMLATGLGLMLLVGLIKIIAMVNESFAETRVLIDLQNRCRSAQMLLQQDLSHISVMPKPPRPVQMDDGYLSLGSTSNLGNNDINNGKFTRGDYTVVDTDLMDDCDYAAFTVFNRDNPFTFIDPADPSRGRTLQTPYAEVVWFVHRNDLYRVVVPFVNCPELACSFRGTSSYESSRISGIPTVRMITPGMLGDLPNRLMHYVWEQCEAYAETKKDIAPQLLNCMVLPNVLSFRVQVWCPKQERYYDLDEMSGSTYYGASDFKHPNYTSSNTMSIRYDTGSTLSYLGSVADADATPDLQTSEEGNLLLNQTLKSDAYSPPTTAFLPGMRIIVRAFDPDSGAVREFRVGQDFRTK